MSAVAFGLIVGAQVAALIVVLSRLAGARRRSPPVVPMPEGLTGTTVSVLVPTYNEVARVGPCLEGLRRQGPPLAEVIVIDSGSKDGTIELVREAVGRDPRVRITEDPALPNGWVGKVWALQHGLSLAQGDWILGMDADTRPQPGAVAAVVNAARAHRYDAVSFAPRFDVMPGREQWLQTSMLVSLIYRSTAPKVATRPDERLLANGQCFLARRDVLLAHGGYDAARASWADDVTLARSLARAGVRVGFLDGSRLYDVAAYGSLRAVWREWGRSFDLSDAASRLRQWGDLALVAATLGLPLPLLGLALVIPPGAGQGALLAVNLILLGIRVALLFALRGSYARVTLGYWLSPLSDPVAAIRLWRSTVRRPTTWRGRPATTA
jgi:dolichol-phosphate mannosyltransferase